jgi:hypothetical protein
VFTSFSFWLNAWTSWRFASRSLFSRTTKSFGNLLELLPEVHDLRLHRASVGLEILDLDLVLRQAAAVRGFRHRQEF